MDHGAPGEDWRDAAAYAALLRADRAAFAWEWLRRDPAYRAAAEASPEVRSASAKASDWGLHRFEEPWLASADARPIWRREAHPYVVTAAARPARSPGDAIDPRRFAALGGIEAASGGVLHLLFSDGARAVRLDVLEGTPADGMIELEYSLFGRASLRPQLLALRRLSALLDIGRFSAVLHPAERGARRWILALRAHDALASGASQREIAAELLSDSAAGRRWRVEAASIRAQVQRLVRAARIAARGGWREFLR